MDAKVTLSGRMVVRPRPVEVDSLGRFSFSGVTPGIYVVEATAGYHHTGYLGTTEPDRRWFIELKAGDRRVGEVIRLIRWAQIPAESSMKRASLLSVSGFPPFFPLIGRDS